MPGLLHRLIPSQHISHDPEFSPDSLWQLLCVMKFTCLSVTHVFCLLEKNNIALESEKFFVFNIRQKYSNPDIIPSKRLHTHMEKTAFVQ